MDRGLYIAASGMIAEQVRQDLLANDLANASTPGYKSDRATQRTFDEVLLSNTKTGQQVGSLGQGVAIDRQATDFTPTNTKQTDEPLDFAIRGDGFFAVQGEDGVRYTRNGRFTTDATGTLITQTGERVLGRNGQPLRADGQGRVDPAQVGAFALANPAKAGEGLYTGQQGAAVATTNVVSGQLETSGADPSRSMVDMIASMRAFEANQRVIRTIDETLDKAVNQVGTTR
ncbi:MAG TPA: flagellar hook-basal body protein [Solirubrobacteraceae bacterium]|nr:flagellar hook-basal body protein [Solirubrobacteraceae bacterium]